MMRLATWFLLGLALVLAAIRAVAFLIYAAYRLPFPLEVFHLEAMMAHLCWRAQHGLSLYPDWKHYPHVANFYGPIYWTTVGLLSRLLRVDLDGVFRVGRSVSFISSLSTALVVGLVLRRRYGRGAACLGALLTLGSASLYGFGAMVRPDVMADLLGLVGFFLVLGRRGPRVAVGVACLVLAGLSKQSYVSYLLAASLALWAEGRWRQALAVLTGCAVTGAVVLVVWTWLGEPNMASDLLGEAKTVWDRPAWLRVLSQLVHQGPEMLILTLIGVVLWTTGSRRQVDLAVLALTMMVVGVVASGKLGADLNYFLALRDVAALAAGTIWGVVISPQARYRPLRLVAVAVMAAVLIPSSMKAAVEAESAYLQTKAIASPSGRSFLASYDQLYRLARNPARHILTDSGMIDIRQGERAVFGDPMRLYTLADVGAIQPTKLKALVDAETYEVIVTTHDIFEDDYATYVFGLPFSVIARARIHYVPAGRGAGLFFYVPRGRPDVRPDSALSPPSTSWRTGLRATPGTALNRT